MSSCSQQAAPEGPSGPLGSGTRIIQHQDGPAMVIKYGYQKKIKPDEVTVIHLVRKKTTIPVPEAHSWTDRFDHHGLCSNVRS